MKKRVMEDQIAFALREVESCGIDRSKMRIGAKETAVSTFRWISFSREAQSAGNTSQKVVQSIETIRSSRSSHADL